MGSILRRSGFEREIISFVVCQGGKGQIWCEEKIIAEVETFFAAEFGRKCASDALENLTRYAFSLQYIPLADNAAKNIKPC